MFKLIGSLLTVGIGYLASFGTALAAENIEQPKYDVIRQTGGVELRQYAPYIVAEVSVEAASRQEASSKGFRMLAAYIFGGNQGADRISMTAPVTTQAGSAGTRIAMTAPVTTSEQEEGTFTIRFSMPSKWTMDTLPVPNDDRVKLKRLEAEKRVAYRFTGDRSRSRIDDATARVDAFIEAEKLEAVSPVIVAGYDGPNVPDADRRWEVMRVVE